MIKLYLFLCRKPGMSFDAFRDHYEHRHVPLASSFNTPLVRYRRNYATGAVAGPPPDCDCITEVWYDLDGAWSDHRDTIVSPHMAKTITEDEALFLDRAATRIVIVDEAESPPGSLPGNNPAPSPE